MKNLKIKLGLLSLLAILAASVFLTSCNQEEIIQNDTQNLDDLTTINVESNQLVDTTILEAEFILPYGYAELSDSEINEYIKSLTYQELLVLVEGRKLIEYFEYFDKVDLLEAELEHGDIVNEKLMKSLLTQKEISEYRDFGSENIVDRGCSGWRDVGSPYCSCTCFFWGCYCKAYQPQSRSCDWWDWRSRHKRRYLYPC